MFEGAFYSTGSSENEYRFKGKIPGACQISIRDQGRNEECEYRPTDNIVIGLALLSWHRFC